MATLRICKPLIPLLCSGLLVPATGLDGPVHPRVKCRLAVRDEGRIVKRTILFLVCTSCFLHRLTDLIRPVEFMRNNLIGGG